MPDDEYVEVVNAEIATRAVNAMIEARRGYLLLLERLVAPHPLKFKFDQSKRNEMMTLLSRADTLWVLQLVNAESAFLEKSAAKVARSQRQALLGEYLTRAAIARGLAIWESGNGETEPSRRHTVAAARLVDAGLSFGLFELADKPDGKQQPVCGTARLAKLLHALGDHAYWVMQEAVENASDNGPRSASGVKEDTAEFKHQSATERVSRAGRVTATDIIMNLMEDKA